MKTKILLFILVWSQATAIFGQTVIANNTKLLVTNDKNTWVEVYITFAAQNKKNQCCATPAGLADFKFLKTVAPLMGKFKLGPKSSQVFDAKGKCFSGNICFYIAPQCPVKGADFNHGKNGTSIAEFTLNPSKTCQETFDISCVNGVNSFIKVITASTAGWVYGPNNTPIDTVYNKDLQQNAGLPGVYPVNCTTCTGTANAPCPSLPKGPVQKQAICNVQRSGRGGLVRVILQNPMPASSRSTALK
ncbi:MAG: hypothetical protein ABI367_13770 [Mucilaginibacter sp.]